MLTRLAYSSLGHYLSWGWEVVDDHGISFHHMRRACHWWDKRYHAHNCLVALKARIFREFRSAVTFPGLSSLSTDRGGHP